MESPTTRPYSHNAFPAPSCENTTAPQAIEGGVLKLLLPFAAALGIPAEQAEGLCHAQPFVSPSGLPCRVHVTPEASAMRPEVLLPLTLNELDATELRRLLVAQAQVLSELGWYLGPSPEGLVMLAAVQWIQDPQQAAAALDLAQHVARRALSQLCGDDTVAQEASA